MDGHYPPPDSLLPLKSAVFHILLVLTENEQHGYRIMREIEHLTGGKIIIGPGTLYRSIKEMLELRLIEESDERPDPELDDERRRYYRLTGYGRRVTRAETDRLQLLVQIARQRGLLEGS